MIINGKPRYNYADGRPIIMDLADGNVALMISSSNGGFAALGSGASTSIDAIQKAAAANAHRITQINGSIRVWGRLSLPVLQAVHGSVYLEDEAYLDAPELRQVHGFMLAELPLDAPAFPRLALVGDGLHIEGKPDAFPALERIDGTLVISNSFLHTSPVLLPKLIGVGGRLSPSKSWDPIDQLPGPIAVAHRLHLLGTSYGNELPGLIVHPPFEPLDALSEGDRHDLYEFSFARWKMHYDALDGLGPSTTDILCRETDEGHAAGLGL